MSNKNEMARIIIELPKSQHRKLKSIAATHGKSMRDLILESLEANDIHLTTATKAKKSDSSAVENKDTKTKKRTFKALKLNTKGFKFNREEIYEE